MVPLIKAVKSLQMSADCPVTSDALALKGILSWISIWIQIHRIMLLRACCKLAIVGPGLIDTEQEAGYYLDINVAPGYMSPCAAMYSFLEVFNILQGLNSLQNASYCVHFWDLHTVFIAPTDNRSATDTSLGSCKWGLRESSLIEDPLHNEFTYLRDTHADN